MNDQLTPIEARVLGSLIEKSITSADYYPLTLNALTAACNQKSNRNPVMQLEETDILHALDELRYNHKLAEQTSITGSRVPKYRHALKNRFTLDPQQTALLCELLLRGPQTVAELRTHAARMTQMPPNDQVEAILNDMAVYDTPLVIKLPRQPGRRETRYQHLLCGMPDMEAISRPPDETVRTLVTDRDARISSLEATVQKQQSAIETLQTAFEEFKKQFE